MNFFDLFREPSYHPHLKDLISLPNQQKLLSFSLSRRIYMELINKRLNKEDKAYLRTLGAEFIYDYLKNNKDELINSIPLKTKSYKIKNIYDPEKLSFTQTQMKRMAKKILIYNKISYKNPEKVNLFKAISKSHSQAKKGKHTMEYYLFDNYSKMKIKEVVANKSISHFLEKF